VIVRQREDFFGEARADAWLWAAARSALLDHFRRQRPEEIADDHPLELLVSADTSTVSAPAAPGANPAECAREAYAVFAAAHADRAEMLARVAFDGWSTDDLAAALKRSPDETRDYLRQTREKLSAYLEPCRAPDA
jgi:DNA-directed RNA polymerase specialized sigma24 family protein